ncbi:hypothetical protein [Streptomyces hydrogenans]|uniref:hypothetical protein n=1 Tax=Streptomyces hydrogenans TaxID=1873719 RepID=UPI003830A0D4
MDSLPPAGDKQAAAYDRHPAGEAAVTLPAISAAFTADTAKAIAEAPEEPGNLTKLTLAPLGSPPRSCPEVMPAWWRLRRTHDSVTGLFETLILVRRKRAEANQGGTRGRLHNDAQDVLRAAIVFTSAGVDAAIQALIHEAVPLLIKQPAGTPRLKYETFVEQQARAPEVEKDFIQALTAQDPRAEILALYIASKTKASFQGHTDLRDRAGGALGITNEQIPKSRFDALKTFFIARNDVAHQLDMEDITQSRTKPVRKSVRAQQDVRKMCDQALLVVRDMIHKTATNLTNCR